MNFFHNSSCEWVDNKWSKKLGRLINAFISALQVEAQEPFNLKLKGGPVRKDVWVWEKCWQDYWLIKVDLKTKGEFHLCPFMFSYHI